MPYPFHLPTTGHLAFQDYLSSPSHPSLPVSATTSRSIVRSALKKHKRLPSASQPSNLPVLLSALQDYIPLLLALDAGLSSRPVADEEIHLSLDKEVVASWRPNLTSAPVPGHEPPRANLQSFEYELLFTLLVLGEVYYLLARSALHILYDAATPTTSARTAAISTAMKHYLEAHSIFQYGSTRAQQLSTTPSVADISPGTLSALASLSLAEATLIAVLKDDPYPAAIVQDRNPADKDWMISAPTIPKVRAHLCARLCLAAADHGSRALATLGTSSKITDTLPRYIADLRKTSRGKACRLLAIDAEASACTGEALAWLHGARSELGFSPPSDDENRHKSSSLSRLKHTWDTRREDKRIEKGAEWGIDAGRFEEGRVVDMLVAKWEKLNNTVDPQAVPGFRGLLAGMPSGREYHVPKGWVAPSPDARELAGMRAPPDPDAAGFRASGDGDDSEEEDGVGKGQVVGAFPGTSRDYY